MPVVNIAEVETGGTNV